MSDTAVTDAEFFDSNETIEQSIPPAQAGRSTDAISLLRKIGRGRYVMLDVLGPDTEFRLELADEIPENCSDPVFLQGAFGSIEVMQGMRLLRTLTGIDLSNESQTDAERWEWLQAAVISRLAATPFAVTEQFSRMPQLPHADPVLLRISLRSDKHALTTYARANAADWLELLSHTDWMQEERLPADILALRHRIPVTIAQHVLPVEEFARLAAGDIIVPTSPAFTCSGEGALHIGWMRADVRYCAPAALEVIKVAGRVELEDLEASAQPQAPIALQTVNALDEADESDELDDVDDVDDVDEPDDADDWDEQENLEETEGSEYLEDEVQRQ